MKRALLLLALCAALGVPAGALAQLAQQPPGQPPSPSPEMHALMDKVHADARAAAFAAVTPAHTSAIAALVAQVTAKTLEPRSAAEQIDGLLTGNEQSAVMAAAQKSRQELFAAMQAAGAPGPMMGGGPPGMGGGPPGMAGPPSGGPEGGPAHRGRHKMSAGRYLLMLSLAPGQLRQLMPRARSSSAQ